MKTAFSPIIGVIAALSGILLSSAPAVADQITLAPNAVGDSTQLDPDPAVENWQNMLTDDGDASFVGTGAEGWKTDLYNLQDPSVSGTINWIRVYVMAKAGAEPTQTSLKTVIKTGGTVFEGGEETLTTSYGEYFTQHNGPWTWTDLEALQAGVSLRKRGTGGGAAWSRATRVWVVVDYTPSVYEGLSHGYWKNHLEDWSATGYTPDQTLVSVFAQSAGFGLGDYTLLEALDFAGGSTLPEKARILLRNAVAAVLNAAHPNIDYVRTVAEVIADVNAALASGDAATILALEAALDVDNNLGGDIDS